ncbi:MAG: ribulose-phosphate 3-epimerase [bacterium]|nr:ribulose-phosphate 3-epimerase [bacterium]
MRLEVVPAILVKREAEFRAKLRIAERLAPLVQIDVMDGKFVPNKTWAVPKVIAQWRTPARFEVHLMVREPFQAVAAWGALARVQRIIVHAEATERLAELLADVHLTGKEVGLAINPKTALREVSPAIAHVDMVLVMANAPGFSGRPFRSATLTRIARLRRQYPALPIGVDSGVNVDTAPRLRAAGATHIAATSAIFDADDPARAYRALRRAFLAG